MALSGWSGTGIARGDRHTPDIQSAIPEWLIYYVARVCRQIEHLKEGGKDVRMNVGV